MNESLKAPVQAGKTHLSAIIEQTLVEQGYDVTVTETGAAASAPKAMAKWRREFLERTHTGHGKKVQIVVTNDV